jgi:hypothetical protein
MLDNKQVRHSRQPSIVPSFDERVCAYLVWQFLSLGGCRRVFEPITSSRGTSHDRAMHYTPESTLRNGDLWEGRDHTGRASGR